MGGEYLLKRLPTAAMELYLIPHFVSYLAGTYSRRASRKRSTSSHPPRHRSRKGVTDEIWGDTIPGVHWTCEPENIMPDAFLLLRVEPHNLRRRSAPVGASLAIKRMVACFLKEAMTEERICEFKSRV